MGVGAPVEDMMIPVGAQGEGGLYLHDGRDFIIMDPILSRFILSSDILMDKRKKMGHAAGDASEY